MQTVSLLHHLNAFCFAIVILASWSISCAAVPCTSHPPEIVTSPTSVTFRRSADQLYVAASCRHLSYIIDMATVQREVEAAALFYTYRQDSAALLNAVYVLDSLGIIDFSSILRRPHVRKSISTLRKAIDDNLFTSGSAAKTWSIVLDQLYDMDQLTRAFASRRSEAIVDLLRILHTSHPRGIFQSVDTYCPHLKEVWDSSRLLRLRCKAANSTVNWYKNNSPFQVSRRVISSRYGDTWYLNILYPRILDAGWYSCAAQRGCASSQSSEALVGFQVEDSLSTSYYPDGIQCSSRQCTVFGIDPVINVTRRTVGELVVKDISTATLILSHIQTDKLTIADCLLDRLIVSNAHVTDHFSLTNTSIKKIEFDEVTAENVQFDGLSVTSGHLSAVQLVTVSMRYCNFNGTTFNNTVLLGVELHNIKMTNVSLYRVSFTNLKASFVLAINIVEDSAAEVNATWNTCAMYNVTSFNSQKRNVSYTNSHDWRYEQLWHSWWLYIHRLNKWSIYNPGPNFMANVFIHTVVNGTFSNVSYINVFMDTYTAVSSSFIDCSYVNVTMNNVTMLNVSAVNHTHVNVSTVLMALANTTWINLISSNAEIVLFVWRNVSYVNVTSDSATMLNGTALELTYVNVVSSRATWESIFFSQLLEVNVNRSNFTATRIAWHISTRTNVTYMDSMFFMCTDWTAAHVNANYFNVISIGCLTVNATEVNGKIVNGTYIDYSTINATTVGACTQNVSYLWGADLVKLRQLYGDRYYATYYSSLSKYIVTWIVYNRTIPRFMGSLKYYSVIGTVNFFPTAIDSYIPTCHYLSRQWRWPSARKLSQTKTWWHLNGWQQRRGAWQNVGGAMWFRPTKELWELWIQHCSTIVPGWLEHRCLLCFVNWVVINSSYVNVTYSSTLYMNVTIINTTTTNMTYRGLTAVNYTEVNVTESNSKWKSFAFMSATIVNSRKQNVTWLNSRWSQLMCVRRLCNSDKLIPSSTPFPRWGWSMTELATSGHVATFTGHAVSCCKSAHYWLDVASNVTIINSTFASMKNTNVTFLNYAFINGRALNCSFTNVKFFNVSYVNVTTMNSTLTNVTEFQATRINSTWINCTSSINSTSVYTVMKNVQFINYSLTNETVSNGTWLNVTFINCTMANITWATLLIQNMTQINVYFTNYTSMEAVLYNASRKHVTFVNSMFEMSTHLNCTFNQLTYLNITCLGCTAINVTETGLMDVNGTWIDYTAVNVTTVGALRKNVSYTNTQQWHGFRYYSNVITNHGNVNMLPFGRSLDSEKRYGRRCSPAPYGSWPRIRIHWWKQDDWYAGAWDGWWTAESWQQIPHKWLKMEGGWYDIWWWRPPSWLWHLWTHYCTKSIAQLARKQGLWPCRNCKQVYTISHSVIFNSTYFNVSVTDMSVFNLTLSKTTLYDVRWSGGTSSHVSIEQSVGILSQLEYHSSSKSLVTNSVFYLCLMSNSAHKAFTAMKTTFYLPSSYNRHLIDTFGNRINVRYKNNVPYETRRLLRHGGWCAVVEAHRRDNHCQSACDTSHVCSSI